ncbi:hypothetical protein ACFFIX_06680 [Metabacillus herbersteinensis]|uniref:Uncharacterized protein n=1 Tax=Metabacillus herbersteinensis TaxID=283816 RepID=A0ABV6GBU0_9BACI
MNLQVITHSGQDKLIEVVEYDPVILNDQINNNEINTILIGNEIFSRIDIKYVGPAQITETL